MTKNQVLAILLRANEFVSGDDISRSLGLSRTAVNMAIKSLRAEGYEIKAVTNRGYLLLHAPDHLTRGALMGYLPAERMKRVECYDKVGSTNYEVMKKVAEGLSAGNVHGTVVIADEQTEGRGRKGRSFSSPKGMGIYLSYLICPTKEQIKTVADAGNDLIWSTITSWSAVAVSRAIGKLCGQRPGIKWVNDLYMNNRKICGILTQTDLGSECCEVNHITVGIGINVHETHEDFPEEIRDIAGSIYSETGVSLVRARLAAEVINELDRMCEKWPQALDEYLSDYREHSILTDRTVTVNYGDHSEVVTAKRIRDDFALIVEDADGLEKTLISGDISLKI